MTSACHAANPLVAVRLADLQVLACVEHHFLAWAPGAGQGLGDLAGRAMLSAILFGGLNDPACWSEWLSSAMKTHRVRSHQSFWFRLKGAAGAHAFRTWYPDPVTGCYVQALRACFQRHPSSSPPSERAEECLKTALDALAAQSPGTAELHVAASRGPLWLNEVCAVRLHLRVPGLLAEHAAGKTRTHARIKPAAVAENPLEQLDDFLATAEPVSPWRPWFTDQALLHLRDDFFPADLTAFDSSRKLRSQMLESLDQQIKVCGQMGSQNSIHRHILLWLRGRLDKNSSSVSPKPGNIRPSTARRYLLELASYDWQGNRHRSIADEDGKAALDQAFTTMELAAEQRPPKRQMVTRAVLKSFSTYLNAQNPNIPVRTFEKTDMDRQKTGGPRRTVLDHPAFMRLLGLLEDWGALSQREGEQDRPGRARACILAAILMFRTGLRGREVTNLALNDIAFDGPFAELVVRGNAARSNKNQFARRTLPLHALLEKDELALLRRWHAERCNEEFRMVPRARLFPAQRAAPLSVDQYLLEPIDAAIRLLFEGSSLGAALRKRPGYWYALASPLRHSFANHLVASLLLPDEPPNLPPPEGLTPDLVSLERKRRLSHALLRPKQHGLAIMQAVRHVMGHASYKRALETYIHNVDWLLALHVWRDVHQPPLSEREIGGLLGLLQPEAPGGVPLRHELVSDRQLRRRRAKAASQHLASSVLPRPRRGRPPGTVQADDRRLSTTYKAFLHQQLPPTVFGKRAPGDAAILVRKQHHDQPFEWGWLVIHNYLCLRARNVGPAEAAEQLAMPVAVCLRWAQRADELAAITKHRYVRKQGRRVPQALENRRFPQLSGRGFPHPRGAAAKLIDQVWAKRAQLEKPRRWASIQSVLARWQLDPPRMISKKALQKRASFYLALGIPEETLFSRIGGGQWERYQPEAFCAPDDRRVMQLSPLRPRGGDEEGGLLHNSVLHALLMLLIDSELDFEKLKNASAARKGSRSPARARPVRLAKMDMLDKDVVPGREDTGQSRG
ncbi:hypothetical protein GVO57_14130 (plasmid) [Sphingomonas changnyeongensis]|uniref:Tyr recombinase domain-containing protein n=1 Tax=Sphingomonas changnyeongensis TaxID=2698679 RepID=A0A7Z2NZ16_9SPHN|nr:site-specific integrase [Sphingomonas changnyeongensis]QHL92027.1 hypothetical protein GVO57_14130 [Sphingomonas changnyeongensis]